MSDISLLEKYFELEADQVAKFKKLRDVYEHWNAQINVISRKDLDSFYERHVLHSLGLNCVIDLKPGTKLLDVGTGGGFPLIPMAIANPECEFFGVDSIGKKIKVVQAVIDELGLTNVKAAQMRAEKHHEKYDFVISRAVTRMHPFVNWVRNNVSKTQKNDLQNGILYLKGGDLGEELAEVKRTINLYDLADYYEEEFFETKKVVHVVIN